MITYEKALELKEAGFPQVGESGSYYVVPSVVEPADYDIQVSREYSSEGVYIPTLSELIEACNEYNYPGFCTDSYFSSLGQNPNPKGGPAWSAWQVNMVAGGTYHVGGTGSTPEEAVASLYIALHEKDKNDFNK